MAAVVLILVYFSFVGGMACLMWKFARVPFPPEATVLSTNEMEFSEEVRTDLRAVTEELAVLGFESADALRLDYGSLSRAFSVVFKSQGTTFAVYHFHTGNRSSYVEFRTCSSRYEDLISIARYPTAIESAVPAAGLLLMVPPMPNYSLLAFHEAARVRILGDEALPIPAELATVRLSQFSLRASVQRRDHGATQRDGSVSLAPSSSLCRPNLASISVH